jgi:hypothetical protein
MASTIRPLAFALVIFDGGSASYKFVAQDGGFNPVITTTAPGHGTLKLIEPAGLTNTFIVMQPLDLASAGQLRWFGSKMLVDGSGHPTGEIEFETDQEAAPMPSALAAISFQILVIAIDSPSLP